MATIKKTYDGIIEEVRACWGGESGDRDAERMKVFLDALIEDYSKVLGFSKEKIIDALEGQRNVNCANWYQAYNFPKLSEGKVYIFETMKEFQEKCPSHTAICPSCKKHTKDFYECEHCKWKSYGLFGTAGKGVRIIIKESFSTHPKPEEIFMPIELEDQSNNS